MLYWPIINMATWGFTSAYLINKFTDTLIFSSSLLASVLLVEVFVRVSTTMLMLFMEEIWSRNLGHMFASPIKFREYTVGMVFVCFIRTAIALTPAILVAKFLFNFSLFSLGWPLLAYIALLAFSGCWYGLLIVSLLLRHGLSAEWMAWMATWLLVPFIAPYYPVSVLPEALQYISWALPMTHVFECVKDQLANNAVQAHYLWTALGLNVLYFAIASFVFWMAYQSARKRGGLLQVGE
ncbi:MAG: ABC transporter permease [Alphaproteobacteria bacterium]